MMFGKRKEPEVVVDRSVGPDGERYPEHVETLAEEAGRVALAKADAYAADFAAEHARQVSGFAFECRRHGDFLTLFITRSGNGEPEKYSWGHNRAEYGKSYSASINLSKVQAIRLIEGHAPDRNFTIEFGIEGVDESGGKSWGGYSAKYAPPKRHPIRDRAEIPRQARRAPRVLPATTTGSCRQQQWDVRLWRVRAGAALQDQAQSGALPATGRRRRGDVRGARSDRLRPRREGP